MVDLAYMLLVFLPHSLLRSFTVAALCGMNRANRCSYLLSLLFPRYGHRLWLPKPYLCRTLRTTPL